MRVAHHTKNVGVSVAGLPMHLGGQMLTILLVDHWLDDSSASVDEPVVDLEDG